MFVVRDASLGSGMNVSDEKVSDTLSLLLCRLVFVV